MRANAFDYQPPEEGFEVIQVAEGYSYRLLRVSYASPLQTPYPENNTAYALHYTPQSKRQGMAIVVLHGLGVETLHAERFICRLLVSLGFDSLLFALPYHLKRTPGGARSGSYFFSLDRERSFNAFRQAILDLRCLGDYLTGEGLSIGVWGTSLGAIVLNHLMGVDGRFTVGVSILGGGNINRIVWQGLLGRFVRVFLKSHGVKERHYEEMLEEFRGFLKEIEKTGHIPEAKWEWWLLDPLTFAHANKSRRLLMFNGCFDLIIPRSCAEELNTALGGPGVCWLPASHFTIGLFLPYIVRRAINLLEEWKPN